MTPLKRISALALLSLTVFPVWSGPVHFCKVIREYDEKDLAAPANIKREDCSGVAFLSYAKDLVKASCWPGAIELLDGKCEPPENIDSADESETTENLESTTEELIGN